MEHKKLLKTIMHYHICFVIEFMNYNPYVMTWHDLEVINFVCIFRRMAGPIRRSTKGGWTEEEVS